MSRSKVNTKTKSFHKVGKKKIKHVLQAAIRVEHILLSVAYIINTHTYKVKEKEH